MEPNKPRLDIIPGKGRRWTLVEVQETRNLLGVFLSISELYEHLSRLDLSQYADSELAGLQRKAAWLNGANGTSDRGISGFEK